MKDPETATIELRGHSLHVVLRTQFDRQFWLSWLPNGWEADTFGFLDETVTPGSIFIDIGAWIGPISLYAAALGARVIALEPDPISLASLQDNARLNGHLPGSVEVLHSAFDAKPGTITIYGNHKGFGTSGSTAVRRGWRSIKVPATTADDLIAKVGDIRPVVMKVDIEAHEYFCSDALARLQTATNAAMHLSVHPATLRKSMRWKSLMGKAHEEVLQRTKSLISGFGDADCYIFDGPNDIGEDALREWLLPASGDPQEFVLAARPKPEASG